MMGRAARGLGGLALLALVTLVACKRTPPPSTDAGAPVAPTVTAPPVDTTTAGPDPTAPRELPSVEQQPTGPVDIEVGVEVIPGKTVTVPGKTDPFEDAAAGVRASAVGCFASLPPGAYSATISVFVTPAGNASTVSVSGASDESVRKCLEQAATRSYPTSADGRKLSIDVSVKG